MSTRSWIVLAILWSLATPSAASVVRRQLAELPTRVAVAEDFNRCVARNAGPEGDCCVTAQRSCALECERIHATCNGDHDGPTACLSACSEAAGWCERGVGLR